jgi:hypothetical protein
MHKEFSMKPFLYTALILGVIAALSTFGIQKYQSYEFWYRLVEEGGLEKVMSRMNVLNDESLSDVRRNLVTMINKEGYKALDGNVLFHVKVPGMVAVYSEQAYQITDPDLADPEITVTVNYDVPVLFMTKTETVSYTKKLRQ